MQIEPFATDVPHKIIFFGLEAYRTEKENVQVQTGMTIDKQCNIYVATCYGVQIFSDEGKLVGMINLPSFPSVFCLAITI